MPTGLDVIDDRDELGKGPFVLIVEDDPTFAAILLDAAHEAGLKGVVSTAGAGTLGMARKLQPSAITLDLGLADIDGFVLLDLLKHDPDTSHIPIHVISGVDRRGAVMGMGAAGVTEKPAEHGALVGVFQSLREQAAKQKPRRRRKPAELATAAVQRLPELAGTKVVIVDDDIRNIFSLTSVLESHDVEVLHAERGKDGIILLEQTPGVDVALIDIMMPDMDGYETMRQVRSPTGARRSAADRGHRQGDEGRPPEVPRCRRIRLYRQARRHRAAAGAAARVGGPLLMTRLRTRISPLPLEAAE